mgnify:CR=1 FL=1
MPEPWEIDPWAANDPEAQAQYWEPQQQEESTAWLEDPDESAWARNYIGSLYGDIEPYLSPGYTRPSFQYAPNLGEGIFGQQVNPSLPFFPQSQPFPIDPYGRQYGAIGLSNRGLNYETMYHELAHQNDPFSLRGPATWAMAKLQGVPYSGGLGWEDYANYASNPNQIDPRLQFMYPWLNWKQGNAFPITRRSW